MAVRRNTHIHVEFVFRYLPPAVGRVLSTLVDIVRIDHFRGIRKQFESAGLEIAAYNYSPRADFTDEEIDRLFEN